MAGSERIVPVADESCLSSPPTCTRCHLKSFIISNITVQSLLFLLHGVELSTSCAAGTRAKTFCSVFGAAEIAKASTVSGPRGRTEQKLGTHAMLTLHNLSHLVYQVRYPVAGAY